MTFANEKARILQILKDRAPARVSTWELIEATRHSRAAGRCWELIEEDGYQIEKSHEGKVHYWRYVGEPGPKQPELFA